jgi:hypothetical protein
MRCDATDDDDGEVPGCEAVGLEEALLPKSFAVEGFDSEAGRIEIRKWSERAKLHYRHPTVVS